MENVFLRVAERGLSAGVVIIVVLLARLLLCKAPKKWSCLLWSAVAFRLCCPVSPRAAFSIFRLIPLSHGTVPTVRPEGTAEAVPEAAETLSPALGAAVRQQASGTGALNPWVTAAAILWLAGMAALLCWGAVSLIRIRRRTADAVLLHGNIYETDRIRSPFILGLVRPKMMLPAGLDAETMKYVLAHERCHIRRRDHLVRPFSFLLLAVYWFQPLCWLAFHLLGRDMEMSCDERVLSEANGIAKAYSRSLLAVAANPRFPAPAPLAFGETDVRRRVEHALNWKKPKSWVTVAAAALCVLTAAACATNPEAPGETAEVTAALDGEYAASLLDCAAEAVRSEIDSYYGPMAERDGYQILRAEITALGEPDFLSGAGAVRDGVLWNVELLPLSCRLLPDHPERVTLSDGLELDEDGWMLPGGGRASMFLLAAATGPEAEWTLLRLVYGDEIAAYQAALEEAGYDASWSRITLAAYQASTDRS